MALRYANTDLTPEGPQGEWASWVAANLSMKWVYPWLRPTWPGVRMQKIAWEGYQPDAPIRPYVLQWPVGAMRWAQFHCIVSENQLMQIRQQVYQSSSYAKQTLEMSWYDAANSDSLVDKITPQLWMLAARPLNQLTLGQPNIVNGVSEGMYLLTLVDDRYFTWFGYNTGNLKITEGTTAWSDVFTSLGTAIGLTITTDTINTAYLKPSNALQAQYEFAPPVMDAACYSVGHRFVVGLDGKCRTRTTSNSKTDVVNNLSLSSARSQQAGGKYSYSLGQNPNDLPAMVPKAVLVAFPRSDNSDYYTVSTTLASLNLPEFAGVTGGSNTATFHDNAIANATGGGTPSNSSTLTTLAQTIATDYYRWAYLQLDLKYRGILAATPEGYHDIEWTYRENEVSTRFMPRPPSMVMELNHGPSPPVGDVGCRVSNTATQSVATNTKAKLTFDTNDYAVPPALHSISVNTSRITIQATGKYIVWCNLRADLTNATPSTTSGFEVNLFLNGSSTKGTANGRCVVNPVVGSTQTNYLFLGFSIEGSYNSGDYLELQFTNNDATTAATISSQIFGCRKSDRGG